MKSIDLPDIFYHDVGDVMSFQASFHKTPGNNWVFLTKVPRVTIPIGFAQ